jgi:translation initiation factor IF-3
METKAAIELARSKGLDLIEVAPNEKPPVCKIMSWSKFKYDLSKRKKKSSRGKAKELKEMWFTPYISVGDREHKLSRVIEFLSKKHPVKITVRVKGRVQREVVTEQLNTIIKLLQGKFETSAQIKFEGRNLSTTLFPTK